MPSLMLINRALISTVFLGLGCNNEAIATERLPDHCQYTSPVNTSYKEPELLGLVSKLPPGAAVVTCQSPDHLDVLTIHSPIHNRDGVSYYISFHYQKQNTANASLLELIEATNGPPVAQETMMALVDDAEINHLSEGFIQADFISIGTFSRLYLQWSAIIQHPDEFVENIKLSNVDEGNEVDYSNFLKSLAGDGDWRIMSLGFASDDIIEYSPNYKIELVKGSRVWAIDFDVDEEYEIKLLAVSEMI